MPNGQLNELRELLLSAPIPLGTRAVAIAASIVLLATVLYLVRRRRLAEEYTPLWVLAAGVTVAVSLWPRPLLPISRALGAWSQASTLFFFALLFLVALCLSYAVRLSTLTFQVKTLSQELALLKHQMESKEEY